MSEQAVPKPRRSYRGILIASIVAGVLALGVGVKAYVFAQGGGWLHGGHGPMSPELISDRVEHFVKFVLSDVDATADQKAKVTTIMQATAKDVFALRAQHVAAHERVHALLSAQTIDRTGLEAVRADQLRLADEASKRIVDGIADAAEVLTPAQRTTLAQKMEQRHRWRHGGD